MTTELPGPGEPPAWAFEAVNLSPYDLRADPVLRGLGALSVALFCLLVAGCGGGHPWWYESGATSCAPPALLHAAGKVTSLGNCAGVYMPPTRRVTLNVGDTVDLHITQEGGGPSGSSPVPVPPAQLPSVSGSSAVARTAASSGQGTATFKAEHAGQATLVIRGFCLLNGQKRTGCRILDVTVR